MGIMYDRGCMKERRYQVQYDTIRYTISLLELLMRTLLLFEFVPAVL